MKFITIIGIFVFTLTFLPTSAGADDWTQKSSAETMPIRGLHAMASIGGDRVALFGGTDISLGGYNGETWVYDLSEDAWTLKSQSSAVIARMGHAMASIGGGKALLFGGEDDTEEYNNETWVYDGNANTWTNKNPGVKPGPRVGHAMADIGENKVLLFGGYPENNQTWVYDVTSNNWTQKSTPPALTARFSHAMAYIGGDKVLLFGGTNNPGESNNETWIYDLSDETWTQVSPSAAPTARNSHAMAYLGGDKVLLFGGGHGGTVDNQTWVYDLSDNQWTLLSPENAPTERGGHAMAPIGTGLVILTAGIPRNRETWLFEFASAIQAQIDIQFCGNPNAFNCKKKGMLPVTIFGTTDLNVTQINFDTLKLCLDSSSDTCRSAVDVEIPVDHGNPALDLGTSQCVNGFANPDGLDDLAVLFSAAEIRTLIGCSTLNKKDPSPTLIIKGELINGTAFISTAVNDTGIDQLCIVNK
jgi:N-acetylneuraminic acid mutarotase